MYIKHGPSSTLICIIYRKSQIFKKENSRNIKENFKNLMKYLEICTSKLFGHISKIFSKWNPQN